MKVVIVDDDKKICRFISGFIADNFSDISVVDITHDIESGYHAINKYSPNLLFLDIRLPDGMGFDLLKKLEPIDFKVIFITAYDEYAIKAIKFSALDYLLKPVGAEDLKEAIDKAEKLVIKELNTQLGVLEDDMRSGGNKKIILKTFENIYLVKVSDIIYCKAEDNYTEFHLLDAVKILVSQTLKEYEEILSDFGFFRVHQSYLINLVHISRFEKAEGGSVILTDDHKVPVASRKKDQVLELLNRISGSI